MIPETNKYLCLLRKRSTSPSLDMLHFQHTSAGGMEKRTSGDKSIPYSTGFSTLPHACSAVQCSTVDCSAVQYSGLQYSGLQYSGLQCSGLLRGLPASPMDESTPAWHVSPPLHVTSRHENDTATSFVHTK